MRTYELMFILKPELSEEEINETKERLHKIINDFGGKFIDELDGWGRKRLAYTIDNYTEGIYCLWHLQGQADIAQELDRVLKISDRVLRHLIVRHEEKQSS